MSSENAQPEPAETSDATGEVGGENTNSDRRIVLVGGAIFLVIMSYQYLKRVYETPEPLPWQRGEAFQAFRINVNDANWVEWSQLRGIGPALAHRIVADRKVNGPFRSIDDIQRVSGIGPTTIQRIRPWLTIGTESKTTSHSD